MKKSSSLKNRIVFFGTPRFAADILQFLLCAQVPVVGVVTQPDRPRGRSMQVSFSEVKELVHSKRPDLPVLQPEKASDEKFLEALASLQADLYVVVAFGQILPQKLLSKPRLGCINVHVSLLPKYRGAAPMQRCLLNGDAETGVSIQKMVRQLDAGDVIAVSKMLIPEDMTFGELEAEMGQKSRELLLQVLRDYEVGEPGSSAQDPSLVTLAPKIEAEELEIHWNKSAREIHNQVRAFSPRPGAWSWMEIGKKRLKILRTKIISESAQESAGRLLFVNKPIVACGIGSLELLEVQPEGKKKMSGGDWFRGVVGFMQFLESSCSN